MNTVVEYGYWGCPCCGSEDVEELPEELFADDGLSHYACLFCDYEWSEKEVVK